MRHLPLFDSTLHYRMLDVSSWKVVLEPLLAAAGIVREKTKPHRAVEDVQASLAELQFYMQYLNIPAPITGV